MSPTTTWTLFQRAETRAMPGRAGSTAGTSTRIDVTHRGAFSRGAHPTHQAARILPRVPGVGGGDGRSARSCPRRDLASRPDRAGLPCSGRCCVGADDLAVAVDWRDGDGPRIARVVRHQLGRDDGGDDAALSVA